VTCLTKPGGEVTCRQIAVLISRPRVGVHSHHL
jgi:hypothetical protein